MRQRPFIAAGIAAGTAAGIAAGACGLLLAGVAQGAPQAAPGPATQQRSEVPDYERIGRFIYAFHRAVSVKRLTDPLVARRAPPELARRALELAQRYERIVQAHAALPDEELRATLREAESVGADLAAWWEAQSALNPRPVAAQ